MKYLTKKQKKELRVFGYFGENYSNVSSKHDSFIFTTQKGNSINVTTGEMSPEEAYFSITERGRDVSCNNIPKLRQYLWGKIWAYRYVDLFEQGNLEGTLTYYDMAISFPEEVIEFLAKSMFQGIDYHNIMELLKEKRNEE